MEDREGGRQLTSNDIAAGPGCELSATPRLHDGRHTAPTLLLAQGVDQRVVMEILGHSQISMTTRYTHVLPEVMTDAADRIGKALWGSL